MVNLTKDQREIIYNKIGRKCLICGTEENIHFHQRYGKKHPCTLLYISKHSSDFAPLCKDCHRQIHCLARLLRKASLDIILKYAEDIMVDPFIKPLTPNRLQKLAKEAIAEAEKDLINYQEIILSS